MNIKLTSDVISYIKTGKLKALSLKELYELGEINIKTLFRALMTIVIFGIIYKLFMIYLPSHTFNYSTKIQASNIKLQNIVNSNIDMLSFLFLALFTIILILLSVIIIEKLFLKVSYFEKMLCCMIGIIFTFNLIDIASKQLAFIIITFIYSDNDEINNEVISKAFTIDLEFITFFCFCLACSSGFRHLIILIHTLLKSKLNIQKKVTNKISNQKDILNQIYLDKRTNYLRRAYTCINFNESSKNEWRINIPAGYKEVTSDDKNYDLFNLACPSVKLDNDQLKDIFLTIEKVSQFQDKGRKSYITTNLINENDINFFKNQLKTI